MLTLLAAALLSGVSAYAGGWAVKVAGCRMLDRPGSYLAYCDTAGFGSYEHEAYAMGFEPAAIRSMQAAQILLLGNSRLQFAFSAPPTARFFAAQGATFHSLGFGYGESSAFPALLLRRYPPHPKLVIINADPFFQPVLSPAANDMLNLGRQAWPDAALKKAFGIVLPWLCTVHLLCSDTIPSTYRDRTTGQWIGHDLMVPPGARNAAITAQKSAPWQPDSLPAWVRDATIFLAALPVPRACILLVGIPTPRVDSEGMAAAIGQALGLPVIRVPIDGLESPDGSHLTAASADRWSAAFFAAAAPRIDACLSDATPYRGKDKDVPLP